MANEHLRATESFLAEGTLFQYRAVKAGTNADQVIPISGATDRALGVLQNDPADGSEATVELMQGAGESKWVAGAAVTLHDLVGVDSVGRVITKSTAGDFVYGRAMDAAGAAGDIIRVALADTVLHA